MNTFGATSVAPERIDTATTMERRGIQLLDLPTEILVHILTPFSTHSLLPLTLICTKIHDLVLRLLHYRLLLAAAAPEYKIILEAYHPSRRYTRPYLFCEYLGTDGLSSKHEGEGSLYHDCDGLLGRLGKLGALYSRFRPEHPDIEGVIPMRRIAGATPVLAQPSDGTGANTSDGWSQSAPATTPIYRNAGDGGNKKVVHSINLDGGELFGQFCTYASLVRLGPRRGVFLSTVNVVEPGQGTIRVWRHWLIERCKELFEAEMSGTSQNPVEQISTTRIPAFRSDPTILWTDYKKNVGIRVQVRHHNPEAYHADDNDDEPLSCDVVIQELLVRTSHLMLAVEDSVASESRDGIGKALIFGSFASRAT